MKVIIDIPEIPKNDKQRWALANGTPYSYGEWIFDGVFHDGSNTIDGDMYHCSVCKRSIVTSVTRVTDIFPFCHCGADMRKEGDQK